DEVFLAAEVVVDRRDVDVGAAGDLAQRSRGEALLGEQFLRRMQDPVLGREMLLGHAVAAGIKRSFEPIPYACVRQASASCRTLVPDAAWGGNRLESSAAISAKPASVRGFSVILGRSGKDARHFRRVFHGAGAHPF